MKICITIDDVLRAKTFQIGTVIKEKINSQISLDELDFSNPNINEVFGFNDYNEWEKFLYEDYAFDIFAKAPVTTKMVDKDLNLWHISLQDYENENVELMLANTMEHNVSICFTYFFLSKAATRIREVFMPEDSDMIWDRCDVLVTADPYLLDTKPQDKKTVKIKMPYNENCQSDFEYATLADMLADKDILDKLTGNKKTEIKDAD